MQKELLFKQVLDDNRGRIYSICCAYEHEKDRRDDLFQEIMINIWKNLDKFKGRSLISTWIYRIAVNTSLMHIRSETNRKKLHSAIADDALAADYHNETEEEIKTGSEIDNLYKNINKLRELDRLIISMMLNDLTYKEISEVTGISVNNVSVKVHRIKKELAKLMGV
jgi:RNA polymerase sigma-70 factor (ECF subfamily)